MERLFVPHSEPMVTVEERDGKPPKITGYAAVYFDPKDTGTEYELWEGVKERIMPGAFDRAIAEGDDVRALFNHDPSLLLGRTKSGTLKLESFSKGLKYTVDPPDTQVARDVIQHIRRGDISGSSFAFRVTDEKWQRSDDVDIREIHGVRLSDVSCVTFPAYQSATVGLRDTGDTTEARSAYDAWKAEQRAELDKAAALKEKLKSIADRAAAVQT